MDEHATRGAGLSPSRDDDPEGLDSAHQEGHEPHHGVATDDAVALGDALFFVDGSTTSAAPSSSLAKDFGDYFPSELGVDEEDEMEDEDDGGDEEEREGGDIALPNNAEGGNQDEASSEASLTAAGPFMERTADVGYATLSTDAQQLNPRVPQTTTAATAAVGTSVPPPQSPPRAVKDGSSPSRPTLASATDVVGGSAGSVVATTVSPSSPKRGHGTAATIAVGSGTVWSAFEGRDPVVDDIRAAAIAALNLAADVTGTTSRRASSGHHSAGTTMLVDSSTADSNGGAAAISHQPFHKLRRRRVQWASLPPPSVAPISRWVAPRDGHGAVRSLQRVLCVQHDWDQELLRYAAAAAASSLSRGSFPPVAKPVRSIEELLQVSNEADVTRVLLTEAHRSGPTSQFTTDTTTSSLTSSSYRSSSTAAFSPGSSSGPSTKSPVPKLLIRKFEDSPTASAQLLLELSRWTFAPRDAASPPSPVNGSSGHQLANDADDGSADVAEDDVDDVDDWTGEPRQSRRRSFVLQVRNPQRVVTPFAKRHVLEGAARLLLLGGSVEQTNWRTTTVRLPRVDAVGPSPVANLSLPGSAATAAVASPVVATASSSLVAPILDDAGWVKSPGGHQLVVTIPARRKRVVVATLS
mgnify:FL=1